MERPLDRYLKKSTPKAEVKRTKKTKEKTKRLVSHEQNLRDAQAIQRELISLLPGSAPEDYIKPEDIPLIDDFLDRMRANTFKGAQLITLKGIRQDSWLRRLLNGGPEYRNQWRGYEIGRANGVNSFICEDRRLRTGTGMPLEDDAELCTGRNVTVGMRQEVRYKANETSAGYEILGPKVYEYDWRKQPLGKVLAAHVRGDF